MFNLSGKRPTTLGSKNGKLAPVVKNPTNKKSLFARRPLLDAARVNGWPDWIQADHKRVGRSEMIFVPSAEGPSIARGDTRP